MRTSVAVGIFVGVMALTGVISLRAHANQMPDCEAASSIGTAKQYPNLAFESYVDLGAPRPGNSVYCTKKDNLAYCEMKFHEIATRKPVTIEITLDESCKVLGYREKGSKHYEPTTL